MLCELTAKINVFIVQSADTLKGNFNNPKSGSWTGECAVLGCKARRNDANGATAQGGAVPSEGRCDPAAGVRARARHPLRYLIPASRGLSCYALGRPIPRSYNAVLCPKKRAIYPVAQAHPKGEVQMIEKG
jgi:hypothetical protein